MGPSMMDAALDYATKGWNVFPVDRTKRPFTTRGYKAATRDIDRVKRWWGIVPMANIGIAVPVGTVVIDVDPRNGGCCSIHEASVALGRLPNTLTCISGRRDGGKHYYFQASIKDPLRHITVRGVKVAGIDVQIGGRGYVVAPPSVHGDTGLEYVWEAPEAAIADLPKGWCEAISRPTPVVEATRPEAVLGRPSDLCARLITWDELLTPLGWAPMSTRGSTTHWIRPSKKQGVSATTNHADRDLLWIFSTAPEIAPLEAGRGYTKYQVFALTQHHGDFGLAARAVRAMRLASWGEAS